MLSVNNIGCCNHLQLCNTGFPQSCLKFIKAISSCSLSCSRSFVTVVSHELTALQAALLNECRAAVWATSSALKQLMQHDISQGLPHHDSPEISACRAVPVILGKGMPN